MSAPPVVVSANQVFCASGEPIYDLPRLITNIIMTEGVEYLRDIAQICTRLARACPDLPTSQGLEEIAIDLMAKAKELEQLYPK
jgi:hypothetical protein